MKKFSMKNLGKAKIIIELEIICKEDILNID